MMLLKNVKFLSTCKLYLVCTSVSLRILHSGGMLTRPLDLPLCERPRVMLVERIGSLAIIEDSIV